MRAIALIPAKLESSKFPNKLLASINGKTVISRTYESVVATSLFQDVIVVTDSELIADEITGQGGKAVISSKEFHTGTDRIADTALGIDADIFVNVQGNQPFVQKGHLEKLLNAFEGEFGKNIQVASLVQKFKDKEQVSNPNSVKVTLDLRQNALYFSRSPIPYIRNIDFPINCFEHVGLYAFRKIALFTFAGWPRSPLETAEQIECLRFIENGIPIRIIISQYPGIQISIPADIEKAEAYLQNNNLQ